MKRAIQIVLVLVLVGLTSAAVAAERAQPAGTPGTPAGQSGSAAVTPTPVVDPTAGLADIPENQAELEAIRAGELKLTQPEDPANTPAVEAARAARRAAYDAVVDEQNAKVQALVDRLAGASPEGAVAIQKEIEREKKATERRLLQVQLEFATRDGDQAHIENIQAALTALDAPAPARTPVDRPVPTNPGR